MHGRDHCPDGADPIPCWPGSTRLVGNVNHTLTVADSSEVSVGLDTWQNEDPDTFDVLLDGSNDAIGVRILLPGLYSVNILWEYSTNFNAAHGVLLVDTASNDYPGTPNYAAYNPTFDGVQFTYPPVLGFVRSVPLWPTPYPYVFTQLVRWEWRAVQYSGVNRNLTGGFVEIIKIADFVPVT